MRLTILPVLLVTASLGLTACGSDDGGSATATTPPDPAAAITAIDGTSAELDKARTALSAGDRAGAEEAAKEAYVSNFENAEAALEEANASLNEAIEDGLGKELLAQFKDGADTATLTAAIADLQEQLAKAKTELGS